MPDNTKTQYSVKNTQPGPRGIWVDGALSYIDPVQDGVENSGTALVDMTADEKATADKTGYFEIKAPTSDQKKAAAATTGQAPASAS